jgi:hypothetical protein
MTDFSAWSDLRMADWHHGAAAEGAFRLIQHLSEADPGSREER